ncbi:Type IV secretory pathway, VirD2 components (relaxase) [Candidatus Burkholderia humilis]|nr:Type IV secretory pathway, VirD2 components (relaxase) [Candidatus Burkholderia humilis]
MRAIGATWLDQQLIDGGKRLGVQGFGDEVRKALEHRAEFLASIGLAERHGSRVSLVRNLLATLRDREVSEVARTMAAETGLAYRPMVDGQRATGIYRRSVMLASGRYATLDDGLGFSLVPWKPVIEQRLGQQVAVTMSGTWASWEMERRGQSI